MEEKTKHYSFPREPLAPELQEQAKSDPELTKKLEIAKPIADRYSETFERPANS